MASVEANTTEYTTLTLTDRLVQLKDARDAGLIDPLEFAAARKACLQNFIGRGIAGGVDAKPTPFVTLDENDVCGICFDSPGPSELGRLAQDSGGGPWLRIDCNHAYHSACLRAQIDAGRKRGPRDKLNFGYVKCGACRSDLQVSDANQTDFLSQLLAPDLRLRAQVRQLQLHHAKHDPVDRIEDIPPNPDEARALIERRIGCFQCGHCNKLFCEGTVCDAGDAAARDDEPRCPECTKPSTPIDLSKCSEPITKCDLCCSVAKYRCPDYYQCEQHHSSGNKYIVRCPGVDKCPLGISHPQNAHKRVGYAIACGCGRC